MSLIKQMENKTELIEKEVLTLCLKGTLIPSMSASETSENLFVFIFICSIVSFEVQYFFDSVRNQASNRKYLLELIKRRLKVN